MRFRPHLGETEPPRNRPFAQERVGYGALAVPDAGHLFFNLHEE